MPGIELQVPTIVFRVENFEFKENFLKLRNDKEETSIPFKNIKLITLKESAFPPNKVRNIGIILIILAFFSLLPNLLVIPMLLGLAFFSIYSGTIHVIMYFLPIILSIVLFYIGVNLILSHEKLSKENVKRYRSIGVFSIVVLILLFPLLLFPLYTAFEIILLVTFLALRNLEYANNLVITLPNQDIILTGKEKTLKELYEKLEEIF